MDKYIEHIDIRPIGPHSQEQCEMAFLVALFYNTNSVDFRTFLGKLKYPGRTKIHKLLKPSWSYSGTPNRNQATFVVARHVSNSTIYVIDWSNIFNFINNFPEIKKFLTSMIYDTKIVNVINILADITVWSTAPVLATVGKISHSNHLLPQNQVFDMEIRF